MAYKPPKRTLAWIVLFSLTGFVDLAQFVIDLTGVGVAVSESTEVAMPAVVIGLLMLFKIPIFTKINRLASIVGVDIGDALTGGLAPFWILDIWYLWWDVRREDRTLLAQAKQEELQRSGMPRPLNEGDVRRPSIEPVALEETSPGEERGQTARNPDTRPLKSPPLNLNGVRRSRNRV